ncbi:hypothetical protein E2C01_090344 [Portunus trituberculatus]|uniref:Uncharacterized protein n=1 Tax=Portunus trituberculatus TaxID=210409 RepID=A0A5B7JPV3_PORTR|nr:hypothetical protein [Portunus trituberculatus]
MHPQSPAIAVFYNYSDIQSHNSHSQQHQQQQQHHYPHSCSPSPPHTRPGTRARGSSVAVEGGVGRARVGMKQRLFVTRREEGVEGSCLRRRWDVSW